MVDVPIQHTHQMVSPVTTWANVISAITHAVMGTLAPTPGSSAAAEPATVTTTLP